MRHVKYILHVDNNGIIKYSEERENNTQLLKYYYEYYDDTTYADKYELHIRNKFYVDTAGVIKYTEGRKNVTQEKRYWEGRTTTFRMVKNRNDGLLDYAYQFNPSSKGNPEKYYQYKAGTKFGVNTGLGNQITYIAFVQQNGTINHVREYSNGNWIGAFEFPANTKINHNKRYWEGRRTTFYMKPNTKSGELTHALQFPPYAYTKFLYQKNTFYGQNHGKRITKIMRL